MANEMLILKKINISPLVHAHETLKAGISEMKTQLERDGLIQRFEYTYELAWKTLKKVLAYRGLDINSPREVFRAAVKEGLIRDPKIWFEFIDKRNLTSHVYNQLFADDVIAVIPRFEQEVAELLKTLRKL